jgi:hypothetical protein
MADGITIRAENLQFDGREWSKAMNRELEDLFIEAARAFLIASTRRIPIRTGFLRGAFTRLEDVIGAFEASGQHKANIEKARSGPRGGKDLASTANRIARLRQRQNRLLAQINRIHVSESRRRESLNRLLHELQEEHGQLQESHLRGAFTANRAVALRQQKAAQSLLKQAAANQKNIARAVEQFKKKIGGKLRSEANDVARDLELRDATLQQKRNEAFQRAVKRLNQNFFGRRQGGPLTVTPRPGFPSRRITGTLTQEQYTQRLTKLREQIGRPTRTQTNIRQRVNQIDTALVDKKQQRILEAFTRRLAAKYRDRIEEARRNDRVDVENDLIQEVQRKLQNARRSIISSNKEDHPLLAAAVRRLQRNERLSAARIEQIRQQINQGEGHINVLARTTRGRIVGQNTPGKFNLQGSERVKKIFNTRDKNGNLLNERREYYYPIKGTPEARILKTPRSGRIFATPGNQIIQVISDPPNPNLVLFQQLAGFVQASGGTVRSDVQRVLQDMGGTNTRYIFHFKVDISYLAVNDARQAWESWQAGILAFNQVIASKGPARLPRLSDFQYTVTRQLRPGQSMTISGRK